MARKQTEIPGTRIKTDVPEAVVEAGETWLEKRREQRRSRDNTATALAGLIALMEANKIEIYPVTDPETGEKFKVKLKTKVTVVATRDRDGAEEEFGIGDGVDGPFSDEPGGPHPSLIAQAERDQAAAGVEVNDEGDVGVPDTAAPKAKRGRKPKKAAAPSQADEPSTELNSDDPVITTGTGEKRRVPKRNATTPTEGEAN